MDRWACIDAPRFSLQILLGDHPEWATLPAAVLDRDHPQGKLLYLNDKARQAGLQQGMRYGQALAMLPHLRAAAVDDERLQDRGHQMAQILQDYSPRVEPHPRRPGLYWLDVSGLYRLYPTWQRWVAPLKEALRQQIAIYVHVVIGFSRFGTFAVICTTGQSGAFETAQRERQAARKAPLNALDMPSSAKQKAQRLGLHTLADLLAMPAEGVRRRLGPEAFAIYRQARGDLRPPNQAIADDDAPHQHKALDHVETNTHRILFLVKRHLHDLLARLTERGEKLAALELVLHRQEGDPIESTIAPAEPTDDDTLIADLVRLRLEALPIQSGITDVALTACGTCTTTEQLTLFCGPNPRDAAAANRALARLRAEFGAQSVVSVVPATGHLPESRFALHPLDNLDLPEPNDDTTATAAVRRFYPTPILLPPMNTPSSPRAGPHTISGGWWVRNVHRDYYLVPHQDRLVWIFYDRRRQKWYLHGGF